jgi:hypothetical protein
VYVPPLVVSLPGLAAVATVILDFLSTVRTENEYRYDIWQATHHALTEHLKNVGHKNLITKLIQMRTVLTPVLFTPRAMLQ